MMTAQLRVEAPRRSAFGWVSLAACTGRPMNPWTAAALEILAFLGAPELLIAP